MRMHGVLQVWFKRGFGFLVTEDRQQYFLHISGLQNPFILPAEGDVLEFEAAEPYKQGGRPQAVNAVIVPKEVRQ